MVQTKAVLETLVAAAQSMGSVALIAAMGGFMSWRQVLNGANRKAVARLLTNLLLPMLLFTKVSAAVAAAGPRIVHWLVLLAYVGFHVGLGILTAAAVSNALSRRRRKVLPRRDADEEEDDDDQDLADEFGALEMVDDAAAAAATTTTPTAVAVEPVGDVNDAKKQWLERKAKDLERLAGMAKKDRTRISYGRLLHIASLLFEGFLVAREHVVGLVVDPGCASSRRRSCGTGTSSKTICACGSTRSCAGRRATRCRCINTWAPWLLCYLGATTSSSSPPSSASTSTTRSSSTPELVQRASAVVKPRWSIRDRMGALLGTRRTSRKPEIVQDRERIRSPSFKPTLDKTAAFIIENFVAIINDDRSSSTGDEFED
mmetsp:Transcript_3881/g.12035  ORF Transcript_3881/g.12035 Transcript_3881/m.12035 type:complete len:373 (+) Transcript_3881:49-1167(+)